MTSQVGSELVIPVNEATLGVVVPLNALPDDEAEILQILQAEQAPLRLWIEFANAYLAAGKKEQCRNVINDGCHPGELLTAGFEVICSRRRGPETVSC